LPLTSPCLCFSGTFLYCVFLGFSHFQFHNPRAIVRVEKSCAIRSVRLVLENVSRASCITSENGWRYIWKSSEREERRERLVKRREDNFMARPWNSIGRYAINDAKIIMELMTDGMSLPLFLSPATFLRWAYIYFIDTLREILCSSPIFRAYSFPCFSNYFLCIRRLNRIEK